MKKTLVRNIVLAVAILSIWCSGAMAAYAALHHDGLMIAVSMLYAAGAACAALQQKNANSSITELRLRGGAWEQNSQFY